MSDIFQVFRPADIPRHGRVPLVRRDATRGQVEAYIQLVLAKALNGRAASTRKRSFDPQSTRHDCRVFLLHLGLIGDEFKTARKHLIAALPGNSTF